MWVERQTRQCAGKLQFSLGICTVVAGEADDKKNLMLACGSKVWAAYAQ